MPYVMDHDEPSPWGTLSNRLYDPKAGHSPNNQYSDKIRHAGHPHVWCPSQGSSETVEWAAKRRFPYLMVFPPIKRIAQIYGEYREACERFGYTASRYQLTVNVPIVVAPTDARACELAQQHVMWVFNTGLRMHPPFWRPPGYMTEASLRRLLANPPKLPR